MSNGSSRTDKIRVGFVIKFNENSWLGGLNYFKSLIGTLTSLPDRFVDPVIFTGKQNFAQLTEEFKQAEIITSTLIDKWTFPWIFRTAFRILLKRDYFLSYLLKINRIDFLSHTNYPESFSQVPSFCWIPDFQHRHLPEYFSPRDRKKRDQVFRKLCILSNGVIISSRAAQQDLEIFCPQALHKSFVLNFVPKPGEEYEEISLERLQRRYQIRAPYFHVPNQFWAHKNHQLIVDALKIMADKGKRVFVVSTGSLVDERKPDFYEQFIKQISAYGLTDLFKPLGIVPYQDMLSIMRNSVAVINPSLFEGWSTTVEEAKNMGKFVILSDIPVHREQNPDRAIFVDPNDPQELAEAFETVLLQFDPEVEKTYSEKAKQDLPARRIAFAMKYQDIVSRAMANNDLKYMSDFMSISQPTD